MRGVRRLASRRGHVPRQEIHHERLWPSSKVAVRLAVLTGLVTWKSSFWSAKFPGVVSPVDVAARRRARRGEIGRGAQRLHAVAHRHRAVAVGIAAGLREDGRRSGEDERGEQGQDANDHDGTYGRTGVIFGATTARRAPAIDTPRFHASKSIPTGQ